MTFSIRIHLFRSNFFFRTLWGRVQRSRTSLLVVNQSLKMIYEGESQRERERVQTNKNKLFYVKMIKS